MASPCNLERLHQLIWTLIYGGLLTLVLGIAMGRTADSVASWVMVLGGSVAAVAGVVLIGVRSRLPADPPR